MKQSARVLRVFPPGGLEATEGTLGAAVEVGAAFEVMGRWAAEVTGTGDRGGGDDDVFTGMPLRLATFVAVGVDMDMDIFAVDNTAAAASST